MLEIEEDKPEYNDIEVSKQLLKHSYCPYSNFQVACHIRTRSGQVFRGVNVENASYGLTMCAEASAISSMITSTGVENEQDRQIDYIYVCSAEKPGKNTLMPCGACRQMLSEFVSSECVICTESVANNEKNTFIFRDIFPFSFRL